jgi:hypothetical protein
VRVLGGTVDIQLRPIAHTHDERAMGHCLFWPAMEVDAVSCTFNPEGFSPMRAVIRGLGREPDDFTAPGVSAYHRRRFSVVSHAFDARPVVITSSRTATWEAEPQAAAEIIRVADIERSRSLCMTHFSFLPGRFPDLAFEQCVRAAMLARYWTQVVQITIDIDERYRRQAEGVLQEALRRWDQSPGAIREAT